MHDAVTSRHVCTQSYFYQGLRSGVVSVRSSHAPPPAHVLSADRVPHYCERTEALLGYLHRFVHPIILNVTHFT